MLLPRFYALSPLLGDYGFGFELLFSCLASILNRSLFIYS